jgi:hypothetical protein
MLLAREQHARVFFAFCQVLRVKAEEISAVEAVEDAILARGKLQVLLIGLLNQAHFLGRDHIHATRAERLYQIAIPRVFIDVEPEHQAACRCAR